MSRSLKLLVAAFGDPGHAFPAIALARGLAERRHRVVLETWERWRDPVEALGIEFQAAEEYETFPPPPPGEGPGAAEAALALAPLLGDLKPDLVISDVITLAPTLAAERAGIRRATLVPHPYPVHDPGMPFFGSGLGPARTPLGWLAWRAGLPLLTTGLRRGRRELNETRERIGLPPLNSFHGGMSGELMLVATFPQLEYPRRWPPETRIVGPLSFELPHPEIEIPGGSGPLVLVAASTAHDPECALIRRSFEALAGEPVRIVATTNGQAPREAIEVPRNGVLVDWLSYSQLMPLSGLVICHGGHGTVARALGAGTPVLISPAVGDMAENGARVQWAGCGLMLPRRLRRPGPLRWAVRRLLGDPAHTNRARQIAGWAERNDPVERAAFTIEKVVAHR